MRVLFALILGIGIYIAGSSLRVAVAQTPPPPPACTSGVSASEASPVARGAAVSQTVTLSRPTGPPCVVGGYPEVRNASEVSSGPLAVGRMSLESSTTLETSATATFVLRYVRAQGASTGLCALSFVINGAKVAGAPLRVEPCTALSEIEVSSFSSAAESPAAAPSSAAPELAPTRSPRPCDARDLRVRIVALDPGAGNVDAIVAVQNRSLEACVLENDVRAQLFDAQGQFAALRMGPVAYPRTTPRRLVLESGYEASLTLRYPATGSDGRACPAVRAIALALGTRGFTASAPAALAPCTGVDGYAVRETPLRLGVPLPGYE